MVLEKIKADIFEISINEDGFYLLEIMDEKEFTLTHFLQLIEAEKKLGEKKRPLLVLSGAHSTTNIETMNAIAKEGTNPYVNAVAIVIQSMHQRILANFYLKILKPNRITKCFNKKEEAVLWLKQYC